MKQLSTLLFICTIFFYSVNAQVPITSSATPVVVDFTGWQGNGFANPPDTGQLSSLDWDFSGAFSDPYVYGGTNVSFDFARGITTGGVTSGGVYALNNTTANDTALWIQPTGSDFTPGEIDLIMVNNTGSDIISFTISYDLLVLNNATRSNSFNFSYSTDGVNYLPVPSLNYTSVETPDGSFTTIAQLANVSPVTVANDSLLYLRWSGDDVTGSGSRDEFGLDNISLTASTGTATPTLSFESVSSSVSEDTGSYMVEVSIDISSPNPTSVTLSVDASSTATFGSDYTGSPTTITFPANSTASQFVTINIINDTIAEGFEQAILNLTNPTNGANILFGQHTANIFDDDNIIVEFVSNSASVSEDGGTITAEVSIINPNMITTSVDVVLSPTGSATSGVDFSYTNTTLTFPGNNSASQTVTITINDDNDFEPSETVVLALTNATNNALYGDSLFTGLIVNDEAAPDGPCENLYISEYLEGFSNNKAVEIYNPTDNAVDLSDYSIARYNNGGTSPNQTFVMSGMLAAGDVYVMGNPSADSIILSESDTLSTITFYNGNDVLELYHFNELIDVIGNIGQDSVWVVDTGSTANFTLVRNADVNSGNTNWTSSAANEWTAYPANTLDQLGSHVADGCAPACPVPTGVNTVITGTKKALLDWDDMPGALGYLVRGRQIGAGGIVELLISNPTSQLLATGLTEGKSYWWEVRTICSADGSVTSAFSVRDTFTLCGPPTSFATNNITQTSALLQWSAVPNALKYELLGKEASAPSSQIVIVPVNAPTTQLPATGLAAGKTYFWTVRSICNAAGTIISDIGNVQSFTTLPNSPAKSVIQAGEASIYPNPASEILSIEVPADFGSYDVSIYDLAGRKVYNQENYSSSILNINVLDMVSGIYFVEINGAEQYRSKVMIK